MDNLLFMIASIMVVEFGLFEFEDYPAPDNQSEWMKY